MLYSKELDLTVLKLIQRELSKEDISPEMIMALVELIKIAWNC